jgi:LmbE family N-acetylglucosaminyl deacetylase
MALGSPLGSRAVAGTLAVIVAHPDDESLWFGGTLLALRGLEMRVIVVCLTNKHNSVRSAEFVAACAQLGAESIMLDYPDGASHALAGAGSAALETLPPGTAASLLGIITHAPHGNERSHPQHIACFDEISRLCADRRVPFGFFAEAPVPGLEPYREAPVHDRVSVAHVKASWTKLLGPELSAVRQHPLRPRPYLSVIRRWMYLRNHWRTPRHVFRIDVDVALKHRLLANYKSQGFDTYQTYYRAEEYLYVNELLRQRLIASLATCPSS